MNYDFDKNTERSKYEELYNKSAGSVFSVAPDDYETVMVRMQEYKPAGKLFMVMPVMPGTSLFTVYGCDHCVVTLNS